jgi:predicted nucleic acid-binding protein
MSDTPILIDNNALVDFFVGEDVLKRDAENLRRKYPIWIAPPLCRYEFGNVLRTYIRNGFVSELDARHMLRHGLSMVRLCTECEEDVILGVANTSALSFYDATYVACARSLEYELYTRDKEILKNCPDIARPISGV